MKRTLLLCISVFFFSLGIYSNSYGITLSSSDYHVWGSILGDLVDESSDPIQNIDREYDVTSSSPLSRSLDLTEFGNTSHHASSTTGLFSVGTSAEDGFQHYGPTSDPDIDVLASSRAYAQAMWTFETLGNNLTINLGVEVGYACYQDIWLHDLTEDIEIFHGNSDYISSTGTLLGEPLYSFNGDFDYSFNIITDPTHEYTIRMYSEAHPGGNALSSSGMSVDLASVPEPATIFLLGIGLLGLAGFGRKQIRRT